MGRADQFIACIVKTDYRLPNFVDYGTSCLLLMREKTGTVASGKLVKRFQEDR
jgi:hypothetical protein